MSTPVSTLSASSARPRCGASFHFFLVQPSLREDLFHLLQDRLVLVCRAQSISERGREAHRGIELTVARLSESKAVLSQLLATIVAGFGCLASPVFTLNSVK